MESIERLRRNAMSSAFVPSAKVLDACDGIEREVSETHMERPVLHDGSRAYVGESVRLVTNHERTFRVSAIGTDCVYSDTNACYGLHEVERRGTVEDVLNEFATKAFHSREMDSHISYRDVIAEYAKMLQIREGQ